MGYKAYDPNRKKKKRKTGLIVCIVVVCVLAAIAGGGAAVYHWQKDNIEALKYAAGHSSEEISEQIEENSRKNQERMSEIAGASMRPLTDEESKLLADGEITEEEAIALVTGEATLEEIQSGEYAPADEQSGSEQPGAGNSEENAASSEGWGGASSAESGSSGGSGGGSASESGTTGSSGGSSNASGGNVSAILGKIYLLQSEFTGSVESLIAQAKGDAGTMSRNELMKKYSSLAASMESSCDARMESLLGELSAAGESQSVISEIRSSYESEKSLKKAELMSRFSN